MVNTTNNDFIVIVNFLYARKKMNCIFVGVDVGGGISVIWKDVHSHCTTTTLLHTQYWNNSRDAPTLRQESHLSYLLICNDLDSFKAQTMPSQWGKCKWGNFSGCFQSLYIYMYLQSGTTSLYISYNSISVRMSAQLISLQRKMSHSAWWWIESKCCFFYTNI